MALVYRVLSKFTRRGQLKPDRSVWRQFLLFLFREWKMYVEGTYNLSKGDHVEICDPLSTAFKTNDDEVLVSSFLLQ